MGWGYLLVLVIMEVSYFVFVVVDIRVLLFIGVLIVVFWYVIV